MAFSFFFTVPICTGHAVDFKIPSDVFLVLFSFEFTFACGSFIPVTMIDGEMVQGSASLRLGFYSHWSCMVRATGGRLVHSERAATSFLFVIDSASTVVSLNLAVSGRVMNLYRSLSAHYYCTLST